MGALEGRQRIEAFTRQRDLAAAAVHEAEDRLEQSGLAHPVASQDRQELAGLEREIDALKGARIAVIGFEILELKHR